MLGTGLSWGPAPRMISSENKRPLQTPPPSALGVRHTLTSVSINEEQSVCVNLCPLHIMHHVYAYVLHFYVHVCTRTCIFKIQTLHRVEGGLRGCSFSTSAAQYSSMLWGRKACAIAQPSCHRHGCIPPAYTLVPLGTEKKTNRRQM